MNPHFSVMETDLAEESNLLPSKNVNIGYGIKATLRSVEGVSDIVKLIFRNECRQFLVKAVSHLQKKVSS